MHSRRIIALIAAAALMLCACDKVKVDEEFLGNNNLCLIDNGRVIHEYDPLTWQVAFNKEKREFRVFTDTMSDYYVVSCGQLPSQIGQEISADIKWSGNSIMTRNNLTFRVEKMDAQGRIWLWSKKNKIAVSVMSLN